MINDEVIAEGWRVLGRLLAGGRKAAGYTQYGLAPLTGYSRSTVGNAEIGRQPVPRAFWKRCDELLPTGGTLTRGYDELQALIRQQHAQAVRAQCGLIDSMADDDVAAGEEGEPHPGQNAQREVPFDPMKRRTLVSWGAATTAATGLGLTTVGSVGAADVARLQRTEARLLSLADRHGGETLWQAGVASVNDGYLLLEQGSYSARVGQRLLMTTGQLQVTTGSLAFDAGRPDVARACCTDALALARQAGDPEVEIAALVDLARVNYVLDQPRQAGRLASAAEQVAASADGPPRLGVTPQLRQAMASSLMADDREADRAITNARKALDRDRDESTDDWYARYAWITPFEIDGIEATCALELGQAARAELLLERAITGYASQYIRVRALYRARLARARLDRGAVDGAVEAANAVLDDLSGGLASWRVSDELDNVAARLAHYPQVDGVDHFLARHRDLKNQNMKA